MLPGRPVVCRLYSFCDALLPVTITFSALITTTKPPMSTDGVYVGLCLPLRVQALANLQTFRQPQFPVDHFGNQQRRGAVSEWHCSV